MARRNPGGRGAHEDYVSRAESRFVREAIQDKEAGWIISHLGEGAYGHYDVTGVTATQSVVNFYAVPDRPQGVLVSAVRLSVAAGAAASSVQTALYGYLEDTFRRMPGTTATFDTTLAGRKAYSLPVSILVSPTPRLFLAVLAIGGTPVLEGFQAGTVITGRPLASLSVTGTTLAGTYERGLLTKSYTTDCPSVVYLSRDANLVL